jgi:hypothetical protein
LCEVAWVGDVEVDAEEGGGVNHSFALMCEVAWIGDAEVDAEEGGQVDHSLALTIDYCRFLSLLECRVVSIWHTWTDVYS